MSPWRTLQWRKPARSSRARERQHVERHVEAKPALDVGAEQFEHPSGAGAEIEQRPDRPIGERRPDRRLHRVIGDMQFADTVPLGGMAREILLRRGHPRRTYGGEPFAVARDGGVVGIEALDELTRERRAAAALAEPEEGPGALAEALDQPGLGEQPQVPRDARLRLPQNVGEVGDRQLGLGKQRDDAQPRLLPGRLEGAVEGREGQLGKLSHGRSPIGHVI